MSLWLVDHRVAKIPGIWKHRSRIRIKDHGTTEPDGTPHFSSSDLLLYAGSHEDLTKLRDGSEQQSRARCSAERQGERRADGAHRTAAFPTRGSAGSPESRRWATGHPHAAALPGAGTCPAYASRNLARKFGGSPRSDGDLAAAGRPLGYFRPAGPTEAGRHRLERAARVAGNARCPAPCGAARPIPGAAGDRRPRPPEAGLTSLRSAAGLWPPAGRGGGAGWPTLGGLSHSLRAEAKPFPKAPHTPRCQNFPLAPALPQMSGLAHSSPVSPT
ncbi:uncharacterized protein LOC125097428 [Lutra lutra]|uniref:uncharacterized protein LOC125097428 n=1 Tax=Lutra lutra TaxID=9657 RepID=UPI001FD27587|nr:uncharacterized protein LOC125097428 [Lutra lutra]